MATGQRETLVQVQKVWLENCKNAKEYLKKMFLAVFFLSNLLWWLLASRASVSLLGGRPERLEKNILWHTRRPVGTAPALVFYCWGKTNIILIDNRGEPGGDNQQVFVDWMSDKFLSRESMMKDILLRLFWKCWMGERGEYGPSDKWEKMICSGGLPMPKYACWVTPDCHPFLSRHLASGGWGCLDLLMIIGANYDCSVSSENWMNNYTPGEGRMGKARGRIGAERGQQ